MKKTKGYVNARFGADVLREALRVFIEMLSDNDIAPDLRIIGMGNEQWAYDTDEEFFAAYRKPCTYAHLYKQLRSGGSSFEYQFRGHDCSVDISRPQAHQIEEVFDVFERNLTAAALPPEPTLLQTNPEIFIGHGRNPIWRELKDHLTDKHGYNVTAYEVGARAGHTIRDILDDILASTSFALLIMTGEDETSDGALRARQNVIHELGLFQGKLGFPRAIAVVEKKLNSSQI